MSPAESRRQERRALRRSGRRRRRGGHGRGPRAVQSTARGVQRTGERVTGRVRRLVRGDRPLVGLVLGVLVLGAVILSGPADSYLDARSRVQALEAKESALDAANQDLVDRVEDLNDPVRIELIAREQQGFVRPGEVAYSLVPPEVERPLITAPRSAVGDEPDRSWLAQARGAVREWLGD